MDDKLILEMLVKKASKAQAKINRMKCEMAALIAENKAISIERADAIRCRDNYELALKAIKSPVLEVDSDTLVEPIQRLIRACQRQLPDHSKDPKISAMVAVRNITGRSMEDCRDIVNQAWTPEALSTSCSSPIPLGPGQARISTEQHTEETIETANADLST